MIAAPLEDAPADVIASWRRLHAAAGMTIHQSPEYSAAVATTGAHTWVVAGEGAIGAFMLRDGIATSLGATRALLMPEAVATEMRLLQRASAVLARTSGARLVYFPHVHTATVGRPDPSTDVAAWQRLPSPHIDCTPRDDLWAQVRRRYGSRATRQRRRAEARGLLQRTLAGDEAADAVDSVERKTWKARAGHSMHHRDQYAVFERLLRDGHITAAALMDGDRPVAFRLDARVRRTVCCLKWSYDEAYQRCSPGFYLLTCGLAHDWDHRTVDRIDLFGSPDTLKALVATGQCARLDLAWPGAAAAPMAAERRAHDRAAARAMRDGIGLRRLYADVAAVGVVAKGTARA